jgi:hypothetical protein
LPFQLIKPLEKLNLNNVIANAGTSNIDHMPIAALAGSSKMPIKKIGGTYTMPVKPGNGGLVPSLRKTNPVLPLLKPRKFLEILIQQFL